MSSQSIISIIEFKTNENTLSPLIGICVCVRRMLRKRSLMRFFENSPSILNRKILLAGEA